MEKTMESFFLYLVSSLRDWLKQKRNQAYLVVLLYLSAYAILDNGLAAAVKYGVMLAIFCFLVSLGFRIYLYLIEGKGSRNCWIFIGISFFVLSIASGILFTAQEIYLLLVLSICLFTVLLMLRLLTESRE